MTATLKSINSLLPYGWTNEDNAEYLSRRPVPANFRIDPASPHTAAADEWEAWLHERAMRMAEFLWPVWKPGLGWKGGAAKHAVELTLADLSLMASLRARMTERILDDSGKPTARHREAFRDEDDGVPGKTLIHYTRSFPEPLMAELTALTVLGGAEIARPASQGLKRQFMRPRPQQVAMYCNLPIVVERSVTAITPAMISGHCIQGSLALASVEGGLDEWLTAYPKLRGELQRFFIDTGDRRVLAGLHYPSDNIGSWYIALCLCTYIWGEQEGRRRRRALWQSIQRHSSVFAAVMRAEKSGKAAVYTPILHRLRRAAQDGDLPEKK